MRTDNPAKHFIFAFAIALIIYIVFYQFIEHRRTRKGPWQVTFTNTPATGPEVVINQMALGISNVHIRFAKTVANSPTSLSIPSDNQHLPITNKQIQLTSTFFFSQPKPVPYDVPFGKCVFMDTTFLPGTLTFQFFGHEIELLPRVLVLDQQEHPWRSGERIALTSTQSFFALPKH